MSYYLIIKDDLEETAETYELEAQTEKLARIEFTNKANKLFLQDDSYFLLNYSCILCQKVNNELIEIKKLESNGCFYVVAIAYDLQNKVCNSDFEQKFNNYEDATRYYFNIYDKIEELAKDQRKKREFKQQNISGFKVFLDYYEKNAELNLKWQKFTF